MSDQIEWNFKLLAHHELDGFGGMGEGMSIQIAKDGRRILWLAHESAPKNFTAVDVSDPRKPKVVVQTDLPQQHMRSNSLETVGDIMAVAYQMPEAGQKPAGFELFDISVPEKPEVDRLRRPLRRQARAACTSSGSATASTCTWRRARPTSSPHNQLDDQCYRIFDVRNPSSAEGGRPLVDAGHARRRQRAAARAPQAPTLDMGFRAHNTNVYPQRPDRCYLGYIDAGMFILDISDKANPKPLCRWDNSPPYHGFTHTVLPLFERDLLVVTDESVVDDADDWPKLVWILDARDETNPVPISTCPLAATTTSRARGGRFGAHNIHENVPLPTSWHSDTIVVGTFFNGGLRAYDISNPYQPEEVGTFVPQAPALRAARHDPAQRRVRRRARHRLHRRPARRRAVHPGDGFLMLHFRSPDIGMFGRRQRHARGHRIPVHALSAGAMHARTA